jgi:hypothetical protein
MKTFKKFLPYLPILILAMGLLAVYLLSLAPDFTWANDGADGGDLITAAATGGVAHPTGYPFYLILARLFQFIPIGTLAYRTNLMSALASIAAAVLIYFLVQRETNGWAGLAAGFAFGLAPLVWSQAVITEVYALHSFFVALILFLTSISTERAVKPEHVKWLDRLKGMVFGFALGNHVTTVLLIPVLLFSALRSDLSESTSALKISLGKFRVRLEFQALMRQLLWMTGAAILVYATLPLRAAFHPPVNWGNPSTWNGFAWLVSGSLYQDQFLFTPTAILLRMQAGIASLLAQFGIVGLAFGLICLFMFFRPSRLMFNTLWIALASVIFAIVYGTYDSFVYLIPAFLCFSIWIGIGLDGIMKASASRWKFAGVMIGLVYAVFIFASAINTWHQVDSARDPIAEQFATMVLTQAPDHAIVFAQGDQAVFDLWYFHYALHQRSDLVVIASDLLAFDWYLDTLRHTYPDLNLPGYLPWTTSVIAENPQRPVCYVRYEAQTEIQCLP